MGLYLVDDYSFIICIEVNLSEMYIETIINSEQNPIIDR